MISALDTRWDIDDGDRVAVQTQAIHGVLGVITSATINTTCIVRSPKRIISSNKSILSFRATVQGISNTNIQMGIWFDSTSYIYFEYDTAVDGNWHLVSRTGGSETDTDSSEAADLSQHIFTIEMLNSSLDFLIDGVSIGTVTTNILTSTSQIHMFNKTLTNASKAFLVDTVTVLQVR